MLAGLAENLPSVRLLDPSLRRTADMADRMAHADILLRWGLFKESDKLRPICCFKVSIYRYCISISVYSLNLGRHAAQEGRPAGGWAGWERLERLRLRLD